MRRVVLGGLLALAVACSNPNDPSNFAQVGGNWTGTLSSSNFAAVAVVLTMSESAGTVTGTWASAIANWNGNINGTVDKTSFTGSFTLNAPNAAGVSNACQGTASVSGPASTNSVTLNLTSAGFTGTCTGEPIGVTIAIQKQ